MLRGEAWAAWLGTTLTGATLGLIALADFGWFRLPLAFAVVAAAGLGGLSMWRPWRSADTPRRPTRVVLIGGSVMVIGALLIAPGSEHIVGPRDSGVYVATGLSLLRHGGLIFADRPLRLVGVSVPSDQYDTWIYRHFANGARLRFPAPYFLRNTEESADVPTPQEVGRFVERFSEALPIQVEGGFLPGLIVWIALVAGFAGLEPALHVSGAFGVLALAFAMLAFHAAERRAGLPSRGWGSILVGAFLATSFPQVWWARETMAEPALSAFAWLGAWAAVRWDETVDARWAFLAALAAIAALFTRADGILIAGALGLCLLFGGASGRRGRWWALTLLAAGLTAYGAHAFLVAPTYLSLTYGPVTFERASHGLVGLLGCAVAVVFVVRFATRRMRLMARVLIVAVLIIIGGLVVHTTLLAGRLEGPVGTPLVGPTSPLAWLPSYVPWPTLLLAWLGALALVLGREARAWLPLLLVGGIPMLFYLPDALVTSDHPWMVRRLVPAAIPFLAMLAALGATRLYAPDRQALDSPPSVDGAPLRRRPPSVWLAGRLLAGAGVGLGLGLAAAQVAPLAMAPRHGSGIIAGLIALAELLPTDGIVVFPGSTAGSALAMPLDAAYGVDTLAIPSRALTPEIVHVLLSWDAQGIPVYWAEPSARPVGVGLTGVSLVEVGRVRIRWSTADGGLSPPPLRLQLVEHDLAVYRVSF